MAEYLKNSAELYGQVRRELKKLGAKKIETKRWLSDNRNSIGTIDGIRVDLNIKRVVPAHRRERDPAQEQYRIWFGYPEAKSFVTLASKFNPVRVAAKLMNYVVERQKWEAELKQAEQNREQWDQLAEQMQNDAILADKHSKILVYATFARPAGVSVAVEELPPDVAQAAISALDQVLRAHDIPDMEE